MDTSLQSLLHSSAQAALSGHTATSWQIMHRYATEFWLDDPTEPLGEFYALRAGAADCLGMADEAVDALFEMQAWAEANDPPVALIARAHLAYQSLNNQDAPVGLTNTVPPADQILNDLATDLESYAQLDKLDKKTSGRLVLAATTAYTVATNMPEAGQDNSMIDRCATLVRHFGTKAPSEADRQLWFAQDHWVNGRRDKARELALHIPEQHPEDVVARFEAYDMLAHFDLIESLEDFEHRPGVARYWKACAEIALTLEAPLMALRRTELACRALMSEGKLEEAATLADRMRTAMEGAPMCPALLELTAIQAEAVFELGDFPEAIRLSQATAEWFELQGDIEEAAQCYTIAALSRIQMGEDAVDVQLRRAELLVQLENFMTAAQAYLALAFATDDEKYITDAWDALSQDPQHPDHLWLVAETHLTTAAVLVSTQQWLRADQAIKTAEELISSLPHAEDLVAELEDIKHRRG